MARRSRRKTSPSKFNSKKFFKDYPIVPLIALVLLIGIWIGFQLGRKSVTWETKTGAKQKTADVTEKKSSERSVKNATRPVSVTSVPVPPVAKTSRDVRVVPVSRKEGPKLVIVIDDIGYNRSYEDELFSLKQRVTIAILPHVPFSEYYAKKAREKKMEVLLHQPMEPKSLNEHPGPGVIRTGMNRFEVEQTFYDNLKGIRGIVGVNNHMGSLATQDEVLMGYFASALRKKDMFFLDSWTTPKSVAFKMAQSAGIQVLKRDVFLDEDKDLESVYRQLDLAARIASEHGFAIAIGHPYPNTLRVLHEKLPELEKEGFRFTTLKKLL